MHTGTYMCCQPQSFHNYWTFAWCLYDTPMVWKCLKTVKKGEWMENSSETVTLPSWQAEQNTLHSNHKGLFEGRDRCSSCDHPARHHPHLPGYTKIQKGEIRQKKPQGKYATLVWANLQVKNVASGDNYLFYPHSDLKHKTHAAGCFLYLLRSLVEHLASAGELVGVGCLSS